MAIPFDYTSEYKRKLRTPEEAARVVKSGDWLDISMGGAFPSLMDEAIAKRKDELRGVKIRGYLIQQPIQMVECDPDREHFIYNSWHMSGYERKLCDRGLCNFNPMVFRNLGAYYDHFLTVNVAITCVTPMNEHGYFNFSVSNASARAVLDKADVVILEVNENLPWVYGGLDECIHIDDVDMIVEGPHGPLPGIKTPAASETEMKIAEYVVQNMVDGSTLQLGIGSLPNAVGQMIARSDLRDLGIHTEMLCDSYLDMYKAGKINNKRKTLDRYKSVFGFAIGSPDLYDWIRENPGVVTYPISYCNDPSIVGKIDNFVSINNCISVDLYGQICAESAGTRQISGTGGQLDFLERGSVCIQEALPLVGPQPDALLFSTGDQLIPELGMGDRDQLLRPLPGAASHQIHAAVFGDDIIGQTPGIGDDIAGSQQRVDAGHRFSLLVGKGGGHTDERLAALGYGGTLQKVQGVYAAYWMGSRTPRTT